MNPAVVFLEGGSRWDDAQTSLFDGGAPILTVAADGTLRAPVLDAEAPGGWLDGLETLNDLRRAAKRPTQVIKVGAPPLYERGE